jgi:hypothetical protein
VEAATYLIAGAITGGKVTVENVIPTHLRSVLAKLKECGAFLLESNRSIEIEMRGRPEAVSVKTMYYPGFPTDVQAPLMALCAVANGTSVITETVFENRFNHAEELARMGARIQIEGQSAIIEGVERLTSALLQAADLRAGAALCLAALAADAVSEIFARNTLTAATRTSPASCAVSAPTYPPRARSSGNMGRWITNLESSVVHLRIFGITDRPSSICWNYRLSIFGSLELLPVHLRFVGIIDCLSSICRKR